jgi:multidrug efflux pump subunit AcrB
MTHEKKHIDESNSKNPSRFSIENPHITWVLLIGTVIWGVYGYLNMPQRKDPDIPL